MKWVIEGLFYRNFFFEPTDIREIEKQKILVRYLIKNLEEICNNNEIQKDIDLFKLIWLVYDSNWNRNMKIKY